MKTILETERLILRELVQEDYNDLCRLLQDDETMYAYEGAFSDQEAQAWLDKQLNRYQTYHFGLWAMIRKDTQEWIGQCGITMQAYKDQEVPEIGYLLQRRYWHQGYATEAAIACREYGFNTLQFPALYSIIRDTNQASQRVALRNGMQPIDTIIKHYRESTCHMMYFASGKKKHHRQPFHKCSQNSKQSRKNVLYNIR